MFFYLVKDNAKWLSDWIFQSAEEAIMSQSWRIDNPACNVDEDFPVTIIEVDTDLMCFSEKIELSKEAFIQEVARLESLKKGGAK